MKTQNHVTVGPVDMHSALARAHADRAAYIGVAFAAVPALVQRLVVKLRSSAQASRARLPHIGAWA